MSDPAFDFPRHVELWSRVAPGFGDDDLSHDREHLLRVYRWSLRLAPGAGADADLAGAAALVHDLVAIAKHDPARSVASQRSALAARDVLGEVGYDPAQVEEICAAVLTSSWSAGLPATSALGRVLQDADRLDAIGAIGIARTFACAQRMVDQGAALELYDAAAPTAWSARAADDRRYALDHFAVKLLELAGSMNLAEAAAEAQRRHAAMVDFIAEFARETAV